MFSRVYKYIGIFIVAIVLLGHHSFQVEAMGKLIHHEIQGDCDNSGCHHNVDVEICEKIQGDEIQTPPYPFTLPKISHFVEIELLEQINFFNTLDNTIERIPISYQQLARSHLS